MAHKILGITDETHICECCGKTNLKRVVVIELESGQIVRYGTTCATKATLITKSQSTWLLDIKKFVDKYDGKYPLERIAKRVQDLNGRETRIVDGKIEMLWEQLGSKKTWVSVS